MSDRIQLFRTKTLNENSPTRVPVYKSQRNNTEKQFLDQIANSREKIMASIDDQIDNYIKKSFQVFNETGELPSTKCNEIGLRKINEGVVIYLSGEQISALKSTNRKPIFDEQKDYYDKHEVQEFPYRTLARPNFQTPPRKEIFFDSPYDTNKIEFLSIETPLKVESKESIPQNSVDDRRVKRISKSKSDVIGNSFDASCKRNIIGAFLQGSRNFLFVNLEEEELKFQILSLNIDKHLPFQSKTVTSKNGDYFLCGGLSEGRITPKLYMLLFNQKSLTELAPMEAPRARHSAIYSQKLNSIFVAGGISEIDSFKPLKSCEIYDLSTGKWKPGAKMNFAAIESTLIEREDFIYKVGGKVDEFTASSYIEKYSINDEKWEVVGYETIGIEQNSLKLSNLAAGFSSSSIIVFGGMIHKIRSNATYKIDVEKTKPTVEEWKSIPLAGPIISPVVQYKGEAFAIQDIGLHFDSERNDCRKKKLLVFSEENWEAVL